MLDCRTCTIVLGSVLSLAALAAVAEPTAVRSRQLIRDRHFLRGFIVYDPAPGKHVERGKLQWEGCIGEPVWGLAQWHSRYSIAGAEPGQLPSGAWRFANDTKSITVARPGTEEADLTLGVDTRLEYPDGPRQQGQDWPHLLASQRLQRCPTIAEMDCLQFHVEARLNHSERFEMPGYSPNLHAAQFQATLTVQNLNRESPGYGDFLWLNLPEYDNRRPVTARFIAPDQALSKMIYTPPGGALADRSTHGSEWVTFDVDILPIATDALNEAWNRGVLRDSQDPDDYRLGGISIGWEVPGTFAVEMQIRNLSLKVTNGALSLRGTPIGSASLQACGGL